MARRPSRLNLIQNNPATLTFPSQTHAPLIRSPLRIPPSPTTPLIPTKPPLRLYLRTILPSPPLSPTILQNEPSKPYPWIWRCHLCHSVYRLAVTRRCLEDGHYFCSLPSPPESEDEKVEMKLGESSEELIKKHTRNANRNREKRKFKSKKAKKKTVVKGCRAEFDYSGWSKYNTWRREVARLRAENGRDSLPSTLTTTSTASSSSSEDFNPSLDSLADAYSRGKENCWTTCNFPSECHNSRLARERLREAQQSKRSRRESVVLDLAPKWEDLRVELKSPTRTEHPHQHPCLSSPHPFPELDTSSSEIEALATLEKQGQESSKISLELTSLIDEEHSNVKFGFGSDFEEKKRKKSIRKIQQLTGLMLGVLDLDPEKVRGILDVRGGPLDEDLVPSSPLKRYFGVDEVEEACGQVEKSFWVEDEDEDEDEEDNGVEDPDEIHRDEIEDETGHSVREGESEDEGRDIQMEELLRARSDFLRRYKKGDVKEFGDEEVY